MDVKFKDVHLDQLPGPACFKKTDVLRKIGEVKIEYSQNTHKKFAKISLDKLKNLCYNYTKETILQNKLGFSLQILTKKKQ
ncbi:MAG: hypothetical protein AUJ85_09625 [Elusimicrobia bacterium CG1_02_37_114]|nr:MAG: hypothetical protein AUJ85_09625 [Elusimicrobia bacterium CG1_02_37_114]PIZ13853.1 MAG: hypothetical protein COY53_02655 [Elusimicrobia bacterium CG_4_10_14_0_8_um_filter_37_32]